MMSGYSIYPCRGSLTSKHHQAKDSHPNSADDVACYGPRTSVNVLLAHQ